MMSAAIWERSWRSFIAASSWDVMLLGVGALTVADGAVAAQASSAREEPHSISVGWLLDMFCYAKRLTNWWKSIEWMKRGERGWRMAGTFWREVIFSSFLSLFSLLLPSPTSTSQYQPNHEFNSRSIRCNGRSSRWRWREEASKKIQGTCAHQNRFLVYISILFDELHNMCTFLLWSLHLNPISTRLIRHVCQR